MAGWFALGVWLGSTNHNSTEDGRDFVLKNTGEFVEQKLPQDAKSCTVSINKDHSYENSLITITTEVSNDNIIWEKINNKQEDGNINSKRDYNQGSYVEYGYLIGVEGYSYFRVRVIKSINSMPLNGFLECY